jgi:hypothetical protein
MKKNALFVLLGCSLLMLGYTSCQSAPKPADPPKPAESGPPASEALKQAADGAAAARQRAIDFESPRYFPSDWESAEAAYAEAGKSGDAAEYRRLSETYDGLFERSVPLYAQAREDEMMMLREAIKASGLTDAFPEYLPRADETALRARDQYEAKAYYPAKDSAAQALRMYQALNTGGDAWAARQDIIGRDFVSYDQENFDRATESGLAAIAAYEAGDSAAAGASAGQSLEGYTLVLQAGWAGYAANCAARAEAERQAALAVKANIAVRGTFDEAEDSYVQGNAALAEAAYEDAAAFFTNAEAVFVLASTAASEKRQAAADVIREAEEKLEQSDEAARQAEITIEGGEQ